MSFELNEIFVPECLGKCNKGTRNRFAPKGICVKLNSKLDGLPLRCVGGWSKQKIFYLLKYFEIFAKAMHLKWDGNINYVEICSGTGRCIDRDSKLEFDGSSLAMLNKQEFQLLSNAIFVDFDNEVIGILKRRFKNLNAGKYHVLHGDYTNSKPLVESLKSLIDVKTGLTLFFIDPTDCGLPFSLITRIKESFPNSDFIINVAIGTDFTRNVLGSIMNPESYVRVRNKYIRFLGSKDFFNDPSTLLLAERGDLHKLRSKFREYYMQSLALIDLKYSAFIRVRPYYDIVFASQNKLGLKFWDAATRNKIDGQKSLRFDN